MAPARPKVDEQLASKLEALHCCFVLADCREPDLPITYASSGFYDLTGYSAEQVLGKNCRFLQGPATSRQKIMEMRDAIREERSCEVCLINYKKNGATFWNQFYLAPVLDEDHLVSHYMGIQSDVTTLMEKMCDSAELAEADSMDSAASSLHASFPDVVSVEQQKAEGVSRVLSSWSSTDGRRSADLLRWSSGPSGVPAQDLPSSLLAPLMRLQKSFVLSDPRQPDCPIVHASTAFLFMTGYPREAVIGRNCRFLQGPHTDKAEVQRMREAMMANPPRPVTVRLLNYRIDGQPFWNNLHVAPIRSSAGEVMFFVGVQLDITKPATPKASNYAPSPLQPSPAQSQSPAANTQQPGPTQQPSAPTSSAASRDAQSVRSPQASHTGQAADADTTHQQTAQPGSPPQQQCPAQIATSEVAEHAVELQEGQRQLLSIQSAPAGSPLAAAAARAALLPDGQDHGLHAQTHAARRRALLADVPECGEATMQHKIDQKGVVGAVRVACRSLCSQGLRRSLEDQAVPRHVQMRTGSPSGRRSLQMRQTY